MAVYKVIQDVEAEDKLLGPLTLKSFIYAMIAGTCAFIEFKLLTTGGSIKFAFMFILFWPMFLFGVLASPLGRDQPTEVWLLSRVRYFLKPRRRIWDQEGLSELVTVTAPKKEELHLTKDLSQTEVQSRLKTLATTLDTRGWAIKNVDVNLDLPDSDSQTVTPDSDRLVGAAGVPKQMAVADVHAADDIMDEKNNPTAKKFDGLMKQADEERKRGLLASLKGMVNEDRREFAEQAGGKKIAASKNTAWAAMKRRETAIISQRKNKEKDDLEKEIAKARAKFNTEFSAGSKKNPSHKIVGGSVPNKATSSGPKDPAAKPVTPVDQSVKMELAQSGNAFSVATLSQLANRPRIEQTGPDEVTISLH